MKKVLCSGFVLMFFFCVWVLPVVAADPSTEVEQLKGEVKKLLHRIEQLEKKQSETATKAVEAEKKMAEVEKKAEKAEKKSLKDRVHLSGEARFRIMSQQNDTSKGFYGGSQPSEDLEKDDETSFPLRIRLNAQAEIVPDIVDFWARLTMNKRWGAYDSSVSASSDPFARPNSFESSIGHDMTPRFEQAYMTFKVPSYNTTWYVGRLPGLDGPPSRQARSLFPRLFIDSEIDGTLIKWDAPGTSLDKVELPWAKTRLWGTQSEPGKAPALKPYEAKVADRTGIILGYLKYDEKKESLPNDADVYLAQAQIKFGKDTAVVLDGLYMDDWHMPNSSADKDVHDIKTPYWLTGFYADTQVLGLQLYGAYYYSHIKIPSHSWVDGTATNTYDGGSFPGHIWYLGLNSGDLISPNIQFCAEYAKGDDAWINPFNYRGYRRKGTVQAAANNYLYNSTGKDTVVGFYPFNAGVWDVYLDYYFRQKVRFRLGLMDFQFDKHETNGSTYSIFGSNKYEHTWWPYFEVNLSF